jgi:hypothetical protein
MVVAVVKYARFVLKAEHSSERRSVQHRQSSLRFSRPTRSCGGRQQEWNPVRKMKWRARHLIDSGEPWPLYWYPLVFPLLQWLLVARLPSCVVTRPGHKAKSLTLVRILDDLLPPSSSRRRREQRGRCHGSRPISFLAASCR